MVAAPSACDSPRFLPLWSELSLRRKGDEGDWEKKGGRGKPLWCLNGHWLNKQPPHLQGPTLVIAMSCSKSQLPIAAVTGEMRPVTLVGDLCVLPATGL